MENKIYFYGNEISNYGVQHNRVDYRTLTQCFNAIICNDITTLFFHIVGGEYSEPELINGSDYDYENDQRIDIFQYYIIDDLGVEILGKYTDEIIYYLPVLDIHIWGITHYGTSWDYVLTDIKINDMED